MQQDTLLFVRKRPLLLSYMIILWIFTQMGHWVSYQEHSAVAIGDWLVGYSAGWVRRGFLGTLLLSLSKASRINAGLILWMFLGLLYMLFLVAVYILLSKQENLYLYLWLIVAPFTLAFPLHIQVFGIPIRKEWLFLTFLAWTGVFAFYKNEILWNTWIIASIIISSLLVLAHELLFFFAPYTWVVWILRSGYRRAWPWIAINTLGLITTMSFILFAKPLPAAKIPVLYENIENTGYALRQKVAGDPIDVLSWGLDDAWSHAYSEYIHSGKERLLKCVMALFMISLAFWPVRDLIKEIWHSIGFMRWGLLTSLLGTIGVMFIAVDWGRFIALHAISWFILVLLLPSKTEYYNHTIPSRRWLWHLLLFIYATGWRIDLNGFAFGNFFSLFTIHFVKYALIPVIFAKSY